MTFLFIFFFFYSYWRYKKKAWNIHPSQYFSIQHLILIFFSSSTVFSFAFQPAAPPTYPHRDAVREPTATTHTPWLKENTEPFRPLVLENLTNGTFVLLEALERHLFKACRLPAPWTMKYIPCPLEINQPISLLSQPLLGSSTLYPLGR